MIFEMVFLLAGIALGSAVTAYYFQSVKIPTQIQQVRQIVTGSVKEETLKHNAKVVQPVVEQVISQIHEVVNIVEEAVLELIVRFQEITDAAIQDANHTAAELRESSHSEMGQDEDHSLLEETNQIIGSFSAECCGILSARYGCGNGGGRSRRQYATDYSLLEEIEFIADQTRLAGAQCRY